MVISMCLLVLTRAKNRSDKRLQQYQWFTSPNAKLKGYRDTVSMWAIFELIVRPNLKLGRVFCLFWWHRRNTVETTKLDSVMHWKNRLLLPLNEDLALYKIISTLSWMLKAIYKEINTTRIRCTKNLRYAASLFILRLTLSFKLRFQSVECFIMLQAQTSIILQNLLHRFKFSKKR